jgi:hypothetical protein
MAGLMDTSGYNEYSRTKGTAVHMATALDDDGLLDEGTLDEAVMPYLVQYRKFRSDTSAHIILIERHVEDSMRGFQGTFDRELMLNGAGWIVDIKAGSGARWHGIQLAAYHLAHGKPNLRRANLYLNTAGYLWLPRQERQDFTDFRAALTLYQRRKEWGLI